MFESVFLIIIGITLIVLNYRAIKKDKNSFNKLLRIEDDNINDYDLEIGKLKAEFAEDIAKLQIQISELKELEKLQKRIEAALSMDETEASDESELYTQETIGEESEPIERKSNNANGNKIKINEIKEMFDKNMDIDEIAQRLNMGKGELLLIKELYLK
ncbi:MAG: hypothetical protein ACM3X7_10625 [Solirubrobacterales bacterium]